MQWSLGADYHGVVLARLRWSRKIGQFVKVYSTLVGQNSFSSENNIVYPVNGRTGITRV